ncbi:MAG TPA: A/G-specific adenine glycosylase [Pirellulaceae bacterium]|nr:A/G-specific adenine glycosylase [Pirellulaceae bacterium]
MSPRSRSPDILSPARRRGLTIRLLDWFAHSARDLPWRRTSDLYAIWISEIMLQQTQVATVIGYWGRFMARFPDVPSLAAADEQDVLRLWEGLGYYRRARQLHAAARVIATEHGGEFPTTYEAVRSLPGIGRYTAGAILSIGLDARLPILEANTIRVLSRLTAFRGDPKSAAGQKQLWSVAEAILPSNRVGAFNQGLMELGSEICTPKAPACGECPVAALCEARRRGLAEAIPRAAKRTVYEDVTEAAVVIRSGNRILLRRCQEGERWAGLWDFPRFAINAIDDGNAAREVSRGVQGLLELRIASPTLLASFKHGVTRFRIALHCFEAELRADSQPIRMRRGTKAIRWVAVEQLTDYPLSVTGRKISHLLVQQVNRQIAPASAARRKCSRCNEG